MSQGRSWLSQVVNARVHAISQARLCNMLNEEWPALTVASSIPLFQLRFCIQEFISTEALGQFAKNHYSVPAECVDKRVTVEAHGALLPFQEFVAGCNGRGIRARMKILVSAIACNPYMGSESYFGWSAVKCLAQIHDLWVITSTRNRLDLTRAADEGLVPANVQFIYVGSDAAWHPNRLLARLQSWKEFNEFAKISLAPALEMHQAVQFDIVHHVTYSTWRVASLMWKLGLPFVFGPLAGNEPFPFRLFPVLSLAGASFEIARKLSNTLSPLSPQVRCSIQKANHIFAITEESEQFMTKIRGSRGGISRLSAGFYSSAKASEFSRFVEGKDSGGVLRLYAAGNLGGQKCISIAFQALSRVKQRGIKFQYHLGSSGPEIPHLKQLAKKLDLTDEIIFGTTMSREEYQRELGRTHIYLLPSMRETVGLTMLEAMLAGCVPIVADNGGPRVTVTPECGYKISISSPNQMADEIADIIESIDKNRSIISEKGPIASKRIMDFHSEDHYLATVDAIYHFLTRKQASA